MAAAARVVLGAVFLGSGIAKLSVRGWARDTTAALKLPFLVTQSTPSVELLVGAGLVTGVRLVPVAALGLLIAYTGVLLVALANADGDAPPCACFGRAAKPITWLTVARNAGLIAIALVTVAA
ncbi:MAG: hypothetical protein H0U92_00280 [Actinobacteria bacterium]|nr:hypothetical protein [Actinomycetota bacterium]